MREFGVLPFRSAVALRCRSETGAPLSRALWAGWRYAVFAALRAAVPVGGRRSLPGDAIPAGGDCAERGAMREFGVLPFRSAVALRCRSETGAPLSRALRAGWRYVAFAALRAAVPVGGRRSLPGDAIPAGGDCAERGVVREFGSLPFAALRAAVPTGGRRSLSCGPCLLVGTAPRGAPRGSSGVFPFAALCAAVPTGGRCSLACGPCRLVGTVLRGSYAGVRGSSLSLRFAQRCRPPPGELAEGRRSLACRTTSPQRLTRDSFQVGGAEGGLLDFAGGGAGDRFHEDDFAGAFVAGQAAFAVGDEFVC